MEFAMESDSFHGVCAQQGCVVVVAGGSDSCPTVCEAQAEQQAQSQEQHHQPQQQLQQSQQLEPYNEACMFWVAVPMQTLVAECGYAADAMDCTAGTICIMPQQQQPQQQQQGFAAGADSEYPHVGHMYYEHYEQDEAFAEPSVWSPMQAAQQPQQQPQPQQQQQQAGYSHGDCHQGWVCASWPNTPEGGKFGGRLCNQRSRHSAARLHGSSVAEDSNLARRVSQLLDGDREQLKDAMGLLREPGVVSRLSSHTTGCRAVQKALDNLSVRDAADLAQDLKGHVLKAIYSPHANYVIQKFIKILPSVSAEAPFIVAEMQAAGIELALDEYGCRVYCRMLEYQAQDPSFASLMDVLLACTDQLVCHRFGHFVVECALEHGLPHQKQQITRVLCQNVVRNVWNRSAVYVVEKGLIHGEDAERQALAAQLLAQTSEEVVKMATSPQGGMVARALLQQPRCIQEKFAEHLHVPSLQGRLRASRHGKKLCEQLRARLAEGEAVVNTCLIAATTTASRGATPSSTHPPQKCLGGHA